MGSARAYNALRNRVGKLLTRLRPPKAEHFGGHSPSGPPIVFIAQRFEYGSMLNAAGFEYLRFMPALRRLAQSLLFIPIESADKNLSMLGELGADVGRVPVLSVFQNKAQLPNQYFALPRDRFSLINWYTDDDMQFAGFSQRVAPYFDLNVTTFEANAARYESIGARVIVSQWAGLEVREFRDSRKFLACFIGRMYGRRGAFVSAIKARFGERVFVHDTRLGHIPEELMKDVYQSSIIAIDEATSFDEKALQIKARIFENCSLGCAVLTNANPALASYLKPGEEVLFYESQDQALRILSDALVSPHRYLAIARRAYDRCRSDHTYDKRFAQIFAAASVPL
jgi:hypothetical protein